MLERWNRKYGDFYGFYEGPQPVIVTSDLEVVKKVCVSDHHTYNQRKARWGKMGQNVEFTYQL